MYDVRRRIHVLHHEDDIFDSQPHWCLDPFHRILLVKDQLHELGVGLDACQWDVDDGALSVLRQDLDEAGLACARGSIQQQSQLVGIARDAVLAGPMIEVVQDLDQSILFWEEQALEGFLTRQFVPSVRPLFFLGLCRDHLVHVSGLVLRLHLALCVQVPRVGFVNELCDLGFFQGLDAHLRRHLHGYVRAVLVLWPVSLLDGEMDLQALFHFDPFLLWHFLSDPVVSLQEPDLCVFLWVIILVVIVMVYFHLHVVVL
mmetsp:Transcript_58130/g.136305  ORF Transcript_58130/g.136305 Transcript_58130/m.136305 type:complete len:258 (-) Transcript_58130:398-1171(-)